MDKKPKIIVILGPTSSGKSDVAINLAKKYNGEIISADSRQIYRGLDIGTGKVKGKIVAVEPLQVFMSDGIAHYMIDIISPKTNYNAAKFKRDAEKIIKDIFRRGKLPIICGGTGFWIKAVVDDVNYPEVKPDWELRNKLRDYSTERLLARLKKLDSSRAKNIDKNNKVRLIRAIEICNKLGRVPFVDSNSFVDSNRNYNFFQIGINLPKEKLYQNIRKRLEKRFRQGMIKEVENLHSKRKLSWKKIESFGLGYFWIPKYLKGEIKTKEELFEKIFTAEKEYAKRQMTWFKKDTRINWQTEYGKIITAINSFIKK